MSVPHIESTTTGPRPRDLEPDTPVGWTRVRVVGLVLLALGVVCLVATTQIPSARDGWSLSGPRVVPLAASIALIALSTLFLVRTVVWRDVDLARYVTAENAGTHWPTPGLLLVALVAYVQLLERLGYALATTLFFLAAARILGSKDSLRDAIVGLAVGIVTAYAFTRWLGVRLPVGRWGV